MPLDGAATPAILLPQTPTFIVSPFVPPAQREAMLTEMARIDARRPFIVDIGRTLLAMLEAEVGGTPTTYQVVHMLMDRVHDFVDYKSDPPDVEEFSWPWYTLGNGQSPRPNPLTGQPKGTGDCEDLAGVVCAWGIGLGLPMHPRWYDQQGSRLNHVAVQVCPGGPFPIPLDLCIPVETTIPGALPGETPYEALARVGPAFLAERIFG